MLKRALATISATLMMATVACAADDYQLTGKPSTQRDDGKIEVVEFFWYGCPHCFSFEPYLAEWEESLAEDVVIRREAPDLNSSWKPHSQAFYAAELMGVSHLMHKPLFDAIHKEKQPLRTLESIGSFVETLGIDKEKFLSTAKSFAVEGRISQARKLAIQYGLTGVPAVVVNGKYRTSASFAGGNEKWTAVIDRLVEQERNN